MDLSENKNVFSILESACNIIVDNSEMIYHDATINQSKKVLEDSNKNIRYEYSDYETSVTKKVFLLDEIVFEISFNAYDNTNKRINLINPLLFINLMSSILLVKS